MAKTDFKSVDEYIASFPKNVQAALRTVRKTIREAVPDADEVISYQMPAYKFHGRLVYFAAFTNHYSLFGSGDAGIQKFQKQLAKYDVEKTTIRFPLDEPVPVKLIAGLTRFRAQENLAAQPKQQ